MKKCNDCGRILSEDNFSKNSKNSDGLSFYCKECSKKHKDLFLFKQGDSNYESAIINELKKYDEIKIDGLDLDKLKYLKIKLYDYPGVIRPLLKDLPKFLIKYDLSYEEYKYFVKKCHNNKFYIE